MNIAISNLSQYRKTIKKNKCDNIRYLYSGK